MTAVLYSPDMREHLSHEIEKRRLQKVDLDRKMLVLETELRLLSDLLLHVEPSRRGALTSDKEPSSSKSHEEKGEGKTRLSPRWACVVRDAVLRYPGSIKNDDVESIQVDHGFDPVGSSNVRSHFWGGVNTGLYERIGQAEFRATQKAADAVGISLGDASHLTNGSNENEPPPDNSGGGSDTGESSAPHESASLWTNHQPETV